MGAGPTGGDNAAKPMTKTDRAKLTSIVRNDFKLLKKELGQRELEVTNQLRSELAEAGKDEIKQVAEDFSKIRAKFLPMDKELAKFQERQAEALRKFREKQEAERQAIHEEMEAFINEARERGLEPAYGYHRHPMQIQHWQIRGLNDRINQAINQVRVQRGQAELALQRQEHNLVRELTVGALESDEAQSFLGQIPTLEQLIPAPDVQELIEAPTETDN